MYQKITNLFVLALMIIGLLQISCGNGSQKEELNVNIGEKTEQVEQGNISNSNTVEQKQTNNDSDLDELQELIEEDNKEKEQIAIDSLRQELKKSAKEREESAKEREESAKEREESAKEREESAKEREEGNQKLLQKTKNLESWFNEHYVNEKEINKNEKLKDDFYKIYTGYQSSIEHLKRNGVPYEKTQKAKDLEPLYEKIKHEIEAKK